MGIWKSTILCSGLLLFVFLVFFLPLHTNLEKINAANRRLHHENERFRMALHDTKNNMARLERNLNFMSRGVERSQQAVTDDSAHTVTRKISDMEVAGFKLFGKSGCVSCHYGTAMGGGSFYKMGIVEAYQTKNPAKGRMGVTGEEKHRFMFKVPTLRNVELTYPYFHDGEAATLSDAVNTMGRLQLGKKFTPDQNKKIVAFLKSLTGDQPTFMMPILPPSNETTPRPQPFE